MAQAMILMLALLVVMKMAMRVILKYSVITLMVLIMTSLHAPKRVVKLILKII